MCDSANRVVFQSTERNILYIQEEAVIMATDYIENILNPKGIALVIKAKHFCMVWRGVKDTKTVTTNSIMRRDLRTNTSLRAEFLRLIQE